MKVLCHSKLTQSFFSFINVFPCYREEFDKHFSPPYNPWEQRFCLAPKGDFYKALGTDKADIVTGHIETFTENGIKMKDGTFIEVRFSRLETGASYNNCM